MYEIDEFHKTYFNLLSRMAPFRKKQDFETIKTVSIIEALLRRAEQVNSGAKADGRYGFDVGHNVQNYISRAKYYIESLEKGDYPLKGKFTEPGTSITDHCFVEKDGIMHLFYNRGFVGYEWDTAPVDCFGHATTTDLINWKIEAPVLTISPDVFETYQVWSPGIVKKGDTYYMYYTGVNINAAQAICMAESNDLYNWTRVSSSPVVIPGEWGNWSPDRWSDCRDPMVFSDDDGIAYMYYCTSKKTLDGGMITAAGIAKSCDMLHFEDLGAKSFDFCKVTLESPFMIKHNGLYYLFYTNCGKGTAYIVSDNPVDGWHGGGMVLSKEGVPANPANVPSCAEVFSFKGKWYISSAERQPGCEQYLEIHEFSFNSDGSVSVGRRLE